MKNIFFTADTHFNHSNIIKFCNRPFGNVLEMNEVLIEKWNTKVKQGDIIYHLGDIGFGEYRYILDRLNGRIVLILGSHDGNALIPRNKSRFKDIYRLFEIQEKGQNITLCHYAMRVWPKSHHGAWYLYGHSHNRLETFGKSFDVGVDGHNFEPWSFDEVVEKMKTLFDNFNLIKKEKNNE